MDQKIELSLVREQNRLSVLPTYIGARGMMIFENYVYSHAEHFAATYTGGYWEMYALSNGGFFMSPSEIGVWNVQVPSNGFEGTMSSQAFGIVCCLFALSHLAALLGDENYSRRFHQLRDFALDHPEVALILGAID